MTLPRPMLASNQVVEDLDSIQYPVIASAKLDGWRSYNALGVPRTRKGLPIPNQFTRAMLSQPEFDGLDGELICGSPTDPNAMQKAQSAFSSHGGKPAFTWYIFDDWRRGINPYYEWWTDKLHNRNLPDFCQVLPQQYITSAADLEQFTAEVLNMGYEGVVTRHPTSPYKGYDGRANRSTRKQEWMLKVKPYTYEEGVIVGFKEKEHNLNAATSDDLGFTKRSHHQAGKVGADTLGSFILHSPNYPTNFKVGCGHLDDATKQLIWDTRKERLGQTVTFRSFKQTGIVNLPRQAQFVSFRAKEDM